MVRRFGGDCCVVIGRAKLCRLSLVRVVKMGTDDRESDGLRARGKAMILQSSEDHRFSGGGTRSDAGRSPENDQATFYNCDRPGTKGSFATTASQIIGSGRPGTHA